MKYAIVESGGKQFRAVEGGTIEVDRLPDESGSKVKLEQVLLLADGENITIGTPIVKNTPVWTTVIKHFKGPKVNIFNYSPKKRIRVKIGHRQNYTRLLVEQIGGSELIKKEPVKVEKAVEVKAEKLAPRAKVEKAEKPVKAEPKARAAASKKAAPSKGKKPEKKSLSKPAAKPSPRKTVPAKTGAKKPLPGKASPRGKTSPKKPSAK
jgi:large subunit ribosomal protein L21